MVEKKHGGWRPNAGETLKNIRIPDDLAREVTALAIRRNDGVRPGREDVNALAVKLLAAGLAVTQDGGIAEAFEAFMRERFRAKTQSGA